MKFVYILVSSKTDFYPEHCALSIYSLKKYNKDSYVCVICDTDTYDYITQEKRLVTDLVDEILPVSINKNFTNHQKSRFLKTSVRNLIDGDFLFIDSDTLITGNLDKLKTFEGEMGAVKVQDSNSWNRDYQHKHFKRYNTLRSLPEDYNYNIDNYFNSGVILCRDTEKTRNFYKTWHELWMESSERYGYHQDQCDFARANVIHHNLVSVLNGSYNLAAIYPEIALKYLRDCKIFHYFTASQKKLEFLKLKSPEFLLEFRNKGFTVCIDKKINNIKKEYKQGIRTEINEKNSILVLIINNLKKKYPWFNIFLKNLYPFISVFKLKRKTPIHK